MEDGKCNGEGLWPLGSSCYRRYRTKRYLVLLLYGIVVSLTGSILLGWVGIQEILYKAGTFENICLTDPDAKLAMFGEVQAIDCTGRRQSINSLFTICYATRLMFSFLGGVILDNLGPRVCFLLGHFFCGIAWCLIFFFPKVEQCVYIGFVLIGLFIEACYTPVIAVLCDLFPSTSSTVISSLGALRSISYFVPALVSFVYDKSRIPLDKLYIIGIVYFFVGHGFAFVLGLFMVPKRRFATEFLDSREEDDEESRDVGCLYFYAKLSNGSCKSAIQLARDGMRHYQFIEYLVFLLGTALFVSSLAILNKAAREFLTTSHGKSAVGIFKYTSGLTFLPSPFLGYFMDKVGPATVTHLLHWSALVYYLLVTFDRYFAKVLACCVYTISGSLCISAIYCYINERFPKLYFGTLSSIVFFFAGLVSLPNIVLYRSALERHETSFTWLATVMIAYTSTACVLSAVLIYISKTRSSPKNESIEPC